MQIDFFCYIYLSGVVDDRIAVLISGFLLLTPKLLAIPSIPDSTGDSQNKAVVTLMEDWEVIDSVAAMCFDTTASNTGRWKGSVALIKRRLNHPIMWIACRHHVYELHIKHVAESIMGKRNSPSEGLFRNFQKEWDQLDQSIEGLSLFDYTGISEDSKKQAEYILSWGMK